MPDIAQLGAAALLEIERIFGAFTDQCRDESSRRAYRRLVAILEASDEDIDAHSSVLARVALVSYAADLVAEIAPRLVDHPARLRQLIDQVEDNACVSRVALAREVLRAQRLVSLPPQLAIEAQLALLTALARAAAACVWAHAPNGDLEVLNRAGDPAALPPQSREIAEAIVAGREVAAVFEDRLAAGAVYRYQQRPAALLVAGDDVLAPDRGLIIEAATPLFTLTLERLAPEATGGATTRAEAATARAAFEQEVLTAAERRLTRLRFDLHDGPQQDVSLLAEDLRLFRQQLEGLLPGEHRERLLGRVDDLQARFVALDGDLRRISVSAQSPFLHQESFEDTLRAVVDAFSGRTGLQPTVELAGDFDALTDSQRITLLGLLREALSNVREHSGADQVSISLAALRGGVTGGVTDNGRGFDPETALVAAARQGHLGLVGMHERVRLLGGNTSIDSKPGGPTVISIDLPPAPRDTSRRSTP